jgi:hypothetical protein
MVTLTVPLVWPEVAVMVTVPAATAVARPLASMVTSLGFDEVQVTLEVMLAEVPSE